MIWTSTLVATLFLQIISLGVGQNTDPDIMLNFSFPPAKPSLMNLHALCHKGNGRARYTDSSFPPSSYAYARRAGKAVNRLEAWFSQCCNGGVARGNVQILCCAKQAWETALSHFCEEEFSTMTLAHDCCEKIGKDKWNCFNRQTPNPFYKAIRGYNAPLIPPEMTFNFDPNTC